MLAQQLDLDLKAAIKNREEVKIRVIRFLKAAIKNKEIEIGVKQLPDADILDLMQKQVKQRHDSIAEFKKGKREDLVANESQEIAVLQNYLPKPIPEAELRAIAQEVIAAVGAASKADTGKVMKELMPRLKGKADGKAVNQVVSSLLK